MGIKSYKTWLFFGYVFLILLVSSIPSDNFPKMPSFFSTDKLIHFIEYSILGFLLVKAINFTEKRKIKYVFAISFLLLFPVIDETYQLLTPGRSSEVLDAVADICGGIIGAAIGLKL